MNRRLMSMVTIAVVLGVYVFLLAPLPEKRTALQDRIETDYVTMLKYERFLERAREAAPKIEESRRRLDELETNVLPRTDTSVGFARLQIDLQGLAEKAGLRIASVKPLPAVSYRYYTGLPIYMECTGNIRQLGSFLKSLDERLLFIGVDRINIVKTPGGLRIKMQLSGLMSRA